ncbi:MAG TPA: hypothetical protein VFA78_00335 [Chloroflexota bacterium]|nr:hypothetical protein [Chloroflexota bacterium]
MIPTRGTGPRALRVIPVLVLIAGCFGFIARSNGSLTLDRSEPRVSAREMQALAQLVSKPIPARNLYTLTSQLRLHPPRTFSHVVRRTSPNYKVGHQDTFWVLGEDKNRFFRLKARILAEEPHIYIYVQNGITVSAAQAQTAADTFEHKIYPTDRKHFGSEWIPGVDGDPHITCLVGHLRSSGLGGYYSAEDEYPTIVNPYSNQREMIYINADSAVPGSGMFDQYVAHEFQHMIHWHTHPHDNAWLNEGMSVLAEYINHYPDPIYATAFGSLPTTQMDAWSGINDPSILAHYGAAYLFLTYLYDRYGSGLIHDIVGESRYTDFQAIDAALQKHHIAETARQLFQQWVVANTLKPEPGHGIYHYPQLPATVSVAKKLTAPFTDRASIPPWAARYVTIEPGTSPIHLKFSGATSVPLVSASGLNFWWSNREDMTETQLERTVDLRHVHQVTLTFQAWYRIEKDYDYAYVEASIDGKSWQTLPATTTTFANPFRASYGAGFTGSSGGWRNETVDLSRFAGHLLHLRFQYVTDDEYNEQSLAVRNIAIPAIGYRDNGAGWHAAGFVHVLGNRLPNQWTVQVIEHTAKGVSVKQMPVGANGRGSLTINPAGLTKIEVAVFTTAPKTTDRSPYTLSAST